MIINFSREVCVSHCIVTFITHKTHGNFAADNKKAHYRKANKISEMLRLYALFIPYEWKALKSSASVEALEALIDG